MTTLVMPSKRERASRVDETPADPGEFERARQDVDEFDDTRALRERTQDAAAELRSLRDSSEISQEDYEKRMSELVQSEHDTERALDLEKERPPGELAESPA